MRKGVVIRAGAKIQGSIETGSYARMAAGPVVLRDLAYEPFDHPI